MSTVTELGSIGSNRLPVLVNEIAAAHAACRRSTLRLRDLTRPAQERLGYIGDHRAPILTPSTHPGFTYVTIVSTEAGVAEGFLRPVRDDAIKRLVVAFWKCMWPASWDRRKSLEHRVNPWLDGAKPAADTDQRGPIDDIIARADRKLDGLGHIGPRCVFPDEGGL